MKIIQRGRFYIVKFRRDNRSKTALLQPTEQDISNGVILAETAAGSGMMQGRLLGGATIEIPAEDVENVMPFGSGVS